MQDNVTATPETATPEATAPVTAAPETAAPEVTVNVTAPVYTAPVGQLKTNKGLLKTILLSIITFGIYGLVVMSAVSNDINIVASRYDGKKTMHYCLLFFIIAPITLGIASIVWFHKISNRIGNELKRRGIAYSFSASDYWLWNVLGSLILVGPFVYMHKMFKAVNLMNAHYNVNG